MSIRKTTMNLNDDIVRQAQEILGTDNATATVHAALRDVIRTFRLQQAAELRFADDAWAETKELRQPRHERDEADRVPPDRADVS